MIPADFAPVRPAVPTRDSWAREQAARTLVRAAMGAAGVVYCRTWPTPELLAQLDETGLERCEARDGWLDSTLDLRDGLSVVEVHAAAPGA